MISPSRSSSTSRAKPDGLAARRAALALYRAVIGEGRAFDDAFATRAAEPGWAKLSPRDRAFARRLATTALRRRGQALHLLGRLLNKGGLPRKAPGLEAILVLGLTELLFLATPPHAALDCAVTLAHEQADTGGFASLVNAVLRRAAREFASDEAMPPVTFNLPDWLRARWTKAYGAETVARIAASHAEEPPLDLSVKGDAKAWAATLEAELLPSGTLRRAVGGRIEALPGFAEGAWWVQDAAAALPARLLGDIAGHEVIDLCAAPGGKTAELAARGARVTAVDKDPRRLQRLKGNLARLHLTADVVEADALEWRPPAPARFVLLDAPCSATGTLRRHPDVAWLKHERDVTELALLQTRLLDAAIDMLAPGGTLVYSVCSLEAEEGADQIAAALARHPALARVPLAPADDPALATFITPGGDLRTLPSDWDDKGGLDGFFAARLTRA